MDKIMTTTFRSERGTTLIETMFALALLLIVMGGIITLSGLSAKTTENNGHLAARTTEDAEDKMEQLQALTYGDSVTDTTVFPSGETATEFTTPLCTPRIRSLPVASSNTRTELS